MKNFPAQYLKFFLLLLILNFSQSHSELLQSKKDSLIEMSETEHMQAFTCVMNIFFSVDTARAIMIPAISDDNQAQKLNDICKRIETDLIPVAEIMKSKYTKDQVYNIMYYDAMQKLSEFINELNEYVKAKQIKTITALFISCSGGNIIDCINKLILSK